MTTDDDRRPDDEPPVLPGSALPPAVQTHLRRSLEVLRERAEDPAVQRRIDDVLAGRGSLRTLASDGGFSSFMEPLVREGLRRMDELSPEEEARAREDAEALDRGEVPERLREGAGDRPGADPAPPSPGTW